MCLEDTNGDAYNIIEKFFQVSAAVKCECKYALLVATGRSAYNFCCRRHIFFPLPTMQKLIKQEEIPNVKRKY